MVEVRVDREIYDKAYEYLQPRAHILRPLEHEDRVIAFTKDDEVVGALLFSDYDGNNIMVHLALDDPKIASRRNIKLMFDYAFNQCKCNRMTGICVDGYERNERLLAGVGFKKEGIIRNIMNVDGIWVNGAIYGILKGECKWV